MTWQARVAVATAVVASWAAALPIFNWKTVPTFAFVSNTSGPFNGQALEALRAYRVVTIDKGQGVFDPSDSSSAEAKMAAAGKALRALAGGNTTVLAYFDALFSWPVYRYTTDLKLHSRWWLRNSTGAVIHLKSTSSFPQPSGGMLVTDYTNTSAAEAFASSCYNLTLSGGIQGCVIDHLQNATAWGTQSLSPSQATAWLSAREQMLEELQAQLGNTTVVLTMDATTPNNTATMFSWYNASTYWIKQHFAAVKAGYMVQVRAGGYKDGTDNFCGNITNSLAAFLIAAGRQSYYACATNFTVNPAWPGAGVTDQWLTPRPEYSRPLGAPTGPAKFANQVYTRSFASNTTVYFNATSRTGLITWLGGKEVQGDVSILAAVHPAWRWVPAEEALDAI